MKNVVSIFCLSMILNSFLHSAQNNDTKKYKSPTKGILLSIGSTAGSIGLGSLIWLSPELMNSSARMWTGGLLIASGVIVGPDVGHFYANNWSRGWKRITTRCLIGLACATSSFILMATVFSSWSAEKEQPEYSIMLGTFILSGGIYVGYTIWDVTTIPGSVREYNESIGQSKKLHLLPNVGMSSKKLGLGLVFAF